MKKYSFNDSQSPKYLIEVDRRIKEDYLVWVEQVLDLIESNYNDALNLNDIGCGLGYFWKGLKRRNLNIDYRGYDLEPLYLQKAIGFFPELKNKLKILDIQSELPEITDITVCSRTLETCNELDSPLEHILITTKKLVIIRTILNYNEERRFIDNKETKESYNLNQYSFLSIAQLFNKYGFSIKFIRDKYTDSLPYFKQPNIIETIYIAIGEKCK